jgi:hypothetical protein
MVMLRREQKKQKRKKQTIILTNKIFYIFNLHKNAIFSDLFFFEKSTNYMIFRLNWKKTYVLCMVGGSYHII